MSVSHRRHFMINDCFDPGILTQSHKHVLCVVDEKKLSITRSCQCVFSFEKWKRIATLVVVDNSFFSQLLIDNVDNTRQNFILTTKTHRREKINCNLRLCTEKIKAQIHISYRCPAVITGLLPYTDHETVRTAERILAFAVSISCHNHILPHIMQVWSYCVSTNAPQIWKISLF